MNTLRILAFSTAFALLCIFARQDIAPTAASAADQAATVVATFPDDLKGVCPGKDGSFLAVTEKTLYLVKADGKVSEISAINTQSTHLPQTTAGWSPTNLARAVRPKDAKFNTPWSVQQVLPGPRKIIPQVILGSYIDLFAPANMIFTHKGKMRGEMMDPHSFTLEVRDLAGNILPGWDVTEPRDYRTQCAFIDGKARVAVTGSSPEDTTCRLLDEKARPLWARPLDKNQRVLDIGISTSTRTVVLPTNQYSGKPPEPNKDGSYPAPPANIVWLLNADNGEILARLSFPRWNLLGMRLSPNGKWAAVWSSYQLTLIDVAGRKMAWQTQLTSMMEIGPRGFYSADVRDDGCVVAGYTDKTRSEKKPGTLYAFNAKGDPIALWKATEKPLLLSSGYRSLSLSPDGRQVTFCSGKQVKSVPLPADITAPKSAPLPKLPPDLQAMTAEQRAAWASSPERKDDPAAFDKLLALLNDTDSAVQIAALHALGKTHDPRAFESMLPLLDSLDYNIRTSAALALGELGDGRAAEPLIAHMYMDRYANQGDQRAFAQGIEILGKEALPALINHIGGFDIENILGQIGEPAVDSLLALLNGDDKRKIRFALQALGATKSPRALQPLLDAAKSEEVEIRRGAIGSFWGGGLWLFPGPEARQALIHALREDTDPNIRSNAAFALGERWEPGNADIMLECLKDTNPQVFSILAESLLYHKDIRALQPLIEALKDPNEEIRANAVLYMPKDPRAVEPIIAVMLTKDETDKVRIQCIYKLQEMGDARAVKPLIDIRNDPNQYIRYRVQIALFELSGRESDAETPEQWRKWWEKHNK